MKRLSSLIAFLVIGLASAAHAAPQDEAKETLEAAEPTPYSDKLLGDLWGIRNTLARYGLDVNLDYQGDVWQVLSGGKKRIATYIDFTEMRTNIDNEKLLGIKGNKVSISLINSNGPSTNASTVGSFQGIDNSETNHLHDVRLYEAWMQQNFFDDRLSLLFGVHDLNTEFASTPVSDNFLVPTFQIGQSFAQSGRNGPSVYPTTSLAARVKVIPTEGSYMAFAVYDGVPGDPRRKGDTIRFDAKDGALLVAELGLNPKAADSDSDVNKLALGGWKYTAAFPDLVTGENKVEQGVYALSSYRFYHDKAKGRDVAAFLRGGANESAATQVDFDYEAGLVANGWLGRENSEIGVGVSGAHNGDRYVDSLGGASDRDETTFELYYRDQVARGITVQPDVVYVVNPGTDQVTDDALIIGARVGVSF